MYIISIGSMILASVIAIILGTVMLFYPGGTIALMGAVFWAMQLIISVFVLSYTVSEAVRYIKFGKKMAGVGYIILGILVTLLVWLFDLGVVYVILSAFFIVSGIFEVIGGFSFAVGKYFMIVLGLLNVMIGVILLKNPIVLPLLIAWYVLFWGISRLFLALEIKSAMK